MADRCDLELPTARQRNVKPNKNNFGITALEIQIVSVLVAGYEIKESAEMLSVSQHSLRHHIASIMAKLGVVNRLELVLVALHTNLIDLIE